MTKEKIMKYDDNYYETDSHCNMSESKILSLLRWRVYVILACQAIVSFVLIYSLLNNNYLNKMLQNNLDVLYIAEITAMMCLFFLSSFEEIRCDQPCGSPVNFVTLLIYTISLTFTMSGVVVMYTNENITSSAFITVFMFLVLTQFASITEYNFAFIGGTGLYFSLISRLITYIFPENNMIIFLMQMFTIILTCIDMLGDTQALEFIKCKDYIMCCANLYFDLHHMFIAILTLSNLPLWDKEQVSYTEMLSQYIIPRI